MQKTGRKYVIFEGSVYDVTDYIGVHPGGTDKIEPLVGQSIDEEFSEAGHTKSARNVFRDLDKVGIIYGNEAGIVDNAKLGANPNIKGLDGTILESKIKLDYSKGLFW
jgi:predicted heme/steroid binding protein